jgi:hypothetical protein
LLTYASGTGESYFALGLTGDLPAAADTGRDYVVLFDTSASQIGRFRTQALACLEAMTQAWHGQDRVLLMAVDTEPVMLTDGYASPGSRQLADGIESLARRVPLGATDMQAALQTALEALPRPSNRGRAVIYIGDGMSAANLVASDQFERLVERYCDARTTVNCFAVGPRVDLHLLGALANHSGGILAIDQAEANPAEIGKALARQASADVFYPTAIEASATLGDLYPKVLPPVRSDRETVFLGRGPVVGPVTVRLHGSYRGEPIEQSWTVQPSAVSPDNAYVADLWQQADRSNGRAIPLAGFEVLRLVQLDRAGQLNQLLVAGKQAVSLRQAGQAERLANEALRLDPGNLEASSVLSAAARVRESGAADDDSRFVLVAQAQESETPLPFLDAQTDGPAAGSQPVERDLLGEMQERTFLQEQVLRAQVREAIKEANTLLSESPDQAIDQLKLALEAVLTSPEIRRTVQAELRREVESALRHAAQEKLRVEQQQIETLRRRAATEQAQRALDLLLQKQNRLEETMNRFNALFDRAKDEGPGILQVLPNRGRTAYDSHEMDFYDRAEVVAREMERLNPREVSPSAAVETLEMSGNLAHVLALRLERQNQYVATLESVEDAFVPFPDEPPLLYPAPEIWERLTLERHARGYDSVDLAPLSTSERKIRAALEEPTTLEFEEESLEDVVQYLQDLHQIPIYVDRRELEDLGITPSEQTVTINLTGISLRSGLRLMLNQLELTYVIQDEVLKITSQELADDLLITKVYPVGDLVVPIIGGGGGGGQGGGGGMMGGGGGGMMGGGGGGFGGGGGGLGGGGGGFNLPFQNGFGAGLFNMTDQPAVQGAVSQPTESSPELAKVMKAVTGTDFAPATRPGQGPGPEVHAQFQVRDSVQKRDEGRQKKSR